MGRAVDGRAVQGVGDEGLRLEGRVRGTPPYRLSPNLPAGDAYGSPARLLRSLGAAVRVLRGAHQGAGSSIAMPEVQ